MVGKVRTVSSTARAAAAVLALASAAACASAPPPCEPGARTRERVVQLWCADLPEPLAAVAVHCWFAVGEPDGRWRSWEIAGGKVFVHDGSWSQVRCHEQWQSWCVGGPSTRLEHEWRGLEAESLARSLEASDVTYPHRHTYCAWPGPNCNTYVAWILRDAGVAWDMNPKAVGKDFIEPALVGAGYTTTRTGLQLETPVLGLKLGILDGLEVHVFAGTFGFGVWPPCLKTPVGRIGPGPGDPKPPRDEITVAVSQGGKSR